MMSELVELPLCPIARANLPVLSQERSLIAYHVGVAFLWSSPILQTDKKAMLNGLAHSCTRCELANAMMLRKDDVLGFTLPASGATFIEMSHVPYA